jgi:drug/metabolite transporter (DMT)-like permease
MLTAAASIWGGMFVVVKSIVGVIPPIQLVWFRYSIAAVVMLLVALAQRIHWRWRKKDVGLMVLMGIVGYALSSVSQETGTWLSSAQLGAVVTASTPAFMVIFNWLILKHKPSVGDWVSLGLAMLGICCIVGLQFSGRQLLLGALSLLVSGLTWALMSTMVRLVSPDVNMLQVTLCSTVVAIICLTPWSLMHLSTLAAVHFSNPAIFLRLGYLGVISTALGFMLWNNGLVRLQSNISGLFFLFQPVVGALLGWLLLGEALTTGFFAGLILLTISILVAIRWA